jgi:hypothetical protein
MMSTIGFSASRSRLLVPIIILPFPAVAPVTKLLKVAVSVTHIVVSVEIVRLHNE